MNVLLIGALVVVGALSFLLPRRTLLLMALLSLVLEASIRKYVFDTPLLFFVKDVFLLVLYLRVFFPVGAVSRVPPSVAFGTLLITLTVLVGGLNPTQPSWLVPLVGIHNWLFYLPLMAVVPRLFRSSEELVEFFRPVVLWCVPLAVVGIVQLLVGPEAWISQTYSKDPDELSYLVLTPAGNELVFRIPSAFASSAAYGDFLLFSALWTFAIFLSRPHNKRDMARIVIVFLMIGLGIGLTGQSGLVMSLVIATPLIFILGLLHASTRPRIRGVIRIAAAGLALLVLFAVLPGTFTLGAARAVWPLTDPAYFGQRLNDHLVDPLAQVIDQAPLGYGSGVVSNGVEYVLDDLPATTTPPPALQPAPEGGYVQTVWELGVPGLLVLLLFICLLGAAIALSLPHARSEVHVALLLIGLASILGLLGWSTVTQKVDDATFSIPLWLTMGGCWLARSEVLSQEGLRGMTSTLEHRRARRRASQPAPG